MPLVFDREAAEEGENEPEFKEMEVVDDEEEPAMREEREEQQPIGEQEEQPAEQGGKSPRRRRGTKSHGWRNMHLSSMPIRPLSTRRRQGGRCSSWLFGRWCSKMAARNGLRLGRSGWTVGGPGCGRVVPVVRSIPVLEGN